MSDKELHNPLYRFLIDTKFRWLRYVVLIVSIGMILANHLYITYEGNTDNVNIYWIIGLYMTAFLTVVYLNGNLLIPKLLLKGRYIEYILTLLGIMFALPLGDICAEYYTHKHYNIPFGQYSFYYSERCQIVDSLSTFFTFTLYLFSISVVVFYKHWIIDVQKIEQLKTEQLHSELDSLKSRVGTEFLLDKLHRAAGYSKTNSLNASRILLQLSRVLRYQLYDCSKESVLLSSEIKFFNDYLSLEKVCNPNFDYTIDYPKALSNGFIPPLLLISIVEESLKTLSEQEGGIWIGVSFNMADNTLIFTCSDNRKKHKANDIDNYPAVFKRLKLLQNQKYSLKTLSNEADGYKVIFKCELQSV